MKNGAERLISLLAAWVMVCWLAGASVSAAGGTVLRPGGSTAVTDASGRIIVAVRLSGPLAGEAVNGDAVTLPVQGVYASPDIDRAPAVTVDTSGVNGVKVNIPLLNRGAGVVAVLTEAGGTERIVKNTIPTRDGIALRVNDGDTVKILDNSVTFVDTRDHWAADTVDFVSARGLFCGTGADTFSPEAEMTRGMVFTVLARYAGVDTGGGAAWYEKGAAWAAASGLSDGTDLDGNITREQLMTVMYRYAILEGKLNGAGVDLRDYIDADCVSGWAAEAVSWAVGTGLIQGAAPEVLDPQGGATRAQVAAVIMRYAEQFGL